ncbi:Dyp-type peroxidase [Caballeronia sp. RCC_10]|uniref:Dyp-type peroxidase n=1 Tax=Caballeronia sp. RCC_10 TaxID=3239227 RepID=UPI0035268407
MSQDNKVPAKESEGLLRRMFARGRRESPGPDTHSGPGTKTTLDLGDIQGFILRGYRMPMVRHFLLKVSVPAEARKLLGRLVSGDESDAPQITTAEDWHIGFEPGPGDDLADAPRRKPDYCLNVGITWQGLIALEIRDRVPTVSFKSFGAFTAGAAERARLVGDTGASAPQNWIGAFGNGSDHVLVTLHAISPEAMTAYDERLSALFAEGGALRELWRGDGMALMEMKDGKPVFTSRVPFGYTDGLSMTTIQGGPERYTPDHQQPCEPWLFVLLDDAENYFVPEPRELGLNGSFAVFKMIATDVVGFENFLQSNKDKIDPELLAAKICGRWRNGVPLALSPETDSPPGGIPFEQLNNYEYVNADGSGDPIGLRCPVGAHMRRINPRGQPVTGQGHPGGSNSTHRLIRRGLPYGPVYDPAQPYDGIERGLLGYFINSSIENQYEFVLGHWVNDSEFAGAVRLHPRSKDPLIGTQEPTESIFVIPQAKGGPPIKITGFSSFTTTKAAAYCFLPSITAIKFISKLG